MLVGAWQRGNDQATVRRLDNAPRCWPLANGREGTWVEPRLDRCVLRAMLREPLERRGSDCIASMPE